MNKEMILDISRLVSSGVIIGICIALWFGLSKIYYVRLKKMMASRKGKEVAQNNTVQHLLYSIVRGIIVFIAIMSVMSIYGINITATVTGLGLASVVVGLALQDSIRDVFRGIGLMSDKFYTVGDVIECNGRVLEVMAFTLRSTKMRDIDTGDIFTIFNGNIDSAVKLSGVQFIDVPLSYKTDYRYINQTMEKIVAEIEQVDGIILCSYKGLQAFEESDCLYRIKITSRQSDRPEMRRAALRVVQKELEAAGIQIPYNQLDVHLEQ